MSIAVLLPSGCESFKIVVRLSELVRLIYEEVKK